MSREEARLAVLLAEMLSYQLAAYSEPLWEAFQEARSKIEDLLSADEVGITCAQAAKLYGQIREGELWKN